MTPDIRTLFHATQPSRPLNMEQDPDRQYYIDFSDVRGGQLIEELQDNITFFSPDTPTCELFTGHIGCGKSTELLRLKAELQDAGFHVVYFESSRDLEMGDVDIGDILLTIARRISESLDRLQLDKPSGLQNLLHGAARLLQTEIELSGEVTTPIGKVSGDTQGKISLDAGIAKLTATAKNSPELRTKLRDYLEPRTTGIIDAINDELIEPAIAKLKQNGKTGLAVIVDNLDRIENTVKPWGRPQPEYLFVDRGEQLRQLRCHFVYTMPLSLMFSNDLGRLSNRFGSDPKVLPMVPLTRRDNSECTEGMALMRQMVLARAFPHLDPEQRCDRLGEIFDSSDTLDRLCRISGGHPRELLRMLNDWIKKDRDLPLSRDGLETVIKSRRNQMTLAITDDEWELLNRVRQRKQVSGDDGYQVLVRSMFVYEYRDGDGSWFDLNPLLQEVK